MHVVITGVGRRLGLALARHFLDQGHQVTGTYRTRYPELDQLTALGARLHPLELTDLNAVRQWAESVRNTHSAVDVLIHNASAFLPTADVPADAVEQFGMLFAVHMQAPMMITEILRPALESSPEETANLIHITDIYAVRPDPSTRTYCATKAGLQSLNDSYAQLLAPKIRVNAIQPGPLAFLPDHTEQDRLRVLQQTPLQKEGGFRPIVQTVDYILANEFLTGAAIPVDGGRRWVSGT